jgi:actin-like ATPase involved in cell morphogenesis
MSVDRGALKRHALGIDFGTSYTVAVARWPDGHTRAILVDGSPLLPSAVYLEPDGTLLAGRDAVHSARLDPARYEPAPKRRIADNQMPLGLPVVDLIAAVLDRIAEEWRRITGAAPADVTLTCPAGWDTDRRRLLTDAAGQAGFGDARLVAEPIAAATYYTEILGHDLPAGSTVLVHDFGAGTLDVSLVARGAGGLEVLATDSRDDIGGLDVDTLIVQHLRARHPDAAWHRLTEPTTVPERRARRQLWDDVRVAKERLSRSQAADLVVPLLDLEEHLTRAELETVAGPLLDRAVQVTERLLQSADQQLSGVFLVGGASRMPLLTTLLQRALGEVPVTIEQPELAIAEGGIVAVVPQPGAAKTAVVPQPGVVAEPGVAETAVVAESGAAETAVAVPGAAETAVVAQPGPAETAVVPQAAAAETVVVRRSHNPDSERVPAESRTSPAPAGASAGPFGAAGLNGIPSAPADGAGPAMPPPVDPWPHAESRLPDPDETVADDGTWRPANVPAAARKPPPSPPDLRPPAGAPALDETVVTYRQLTSPRSKRKSRASASQQPADTRKGSPPRAAARPAPARQPQRRPGGFLRFLEILLSIIVLVAIPLAAMVLAYSYGTGEPFRDAALELARDLRDLIRP